MGGCPSPGWVGIFWVPPPLVKHSSGGKPHSNESNFSNIALDISNRKSVFFCGQELSRILFAFLDSADPAIIFFV